MDPESDEKKVYDKLKSMSNEWKIVHAVDFRKQRQIYRRGIREIINILREKLILLRHIPSMA